MGPRRAGVLVKHVAAWGVAAPILASCPAAALLIAPIWIAKARKDAIRAHCRDEGRTGCGKATLGESLAFTLAKRAASSVCDGGLISGPLMAADLLESLADSD
jgi:hypothetical protein